MAEFCLKCFVNKILTDKDLHSIKAIHMSETSDVCEGCNRYAKYVRSIDKCSEVVGNNNDAIISANALARYVIWYANKNKVRITSLKLQILLFFIQIEYVRMKKSLLFNESVSMGPYGPRINSVYFEYCPEGALPLLSMSEEDGDVSYLTYADIGLINKVLNVKMHLSVSSLKQESFQKLYPCLLERKNGDNGNNKLQMTIDDFLNIANCST